MRTKAELLRLRSPADTGEIENLYRKSMDQARGQKALYWELSTATSLAELLQCQGRDMEARAVLAPIYDRFTEGFSAARMRQAKTLLERLA